MAKLFLETIFVLTVFTKLSHPHPLFYVKPNSRNTPLTFFILFSFRIHFTASLSYISATPSLPRKLPEAIRILDSVNLAMDSCKSKAGFSMRPVRRARGDPRRTLIIKDGWTSYHVQGKGILTIVTTYVFVYSAGVE